MMEQGNLAAIAITVIPLLWFATLFFVKREISRLLKKVEKIPDDAFFPNTSWYESINSALRRIPSEDFMRHITIHIDKSAETWKNVDRHGFELAALWKKVDTDHDRLGRTEADVMMNKQRLDFLEHMKGGNR